MEEDDALTPEQWAEIEKRLDADEEMTPHEEVARQLRERFS